ncbi:MAG: hypothetical protein LAO20_15735 [Acidobacteriia bacterium]|nr:hypothetical protein [Terriglobia bacterium]
MDNETLRAIFQMFGDKLYDLQVGFAAMFNMCIDHHAFTERAFLAEKGRLEALPDFQKLRETLEKLRSSKEEADFESFLRAYKGPVQ